MMFKKYIVFSSFILITCIFMLLKKQPEKQENNIDCIKQINEQNATIHSISCNLKSETTDSYFFYSKPNKVILNTYFLNREESKISSDGEFYWFWIKKFDSKSIYYCPTNKIDNTRVIDPLKPDLIKSIICIDEIPIKSDIRLSDKIEILFKDGIYDRTIIIKDCKIKEQHWSQNNILILSIYVLEYNQIPTLIKVIWHEENYSAKIRINNIKINPNEEKSFEMPDLKKINLEELF